MDDVTIFYNGECSKCRGAMDILRDRDIDPDVVEYLTDAPTAEEIRGLLTKLGVGAREMVRDSEPAFTELGLEGASDEELIAAMAQHPVLIQRPIVVVGDKAVIGRPPEKILDLIGPGRDGAPAPEH